MMEGEEKGWKEVGFVTSGGEMWQDFIVEESYTIHFI